jgi:hypothetical protein
MIPRGTVIAALLVVELAILGEVVVAMRGSQSAQHLGGRAASGPYLVEGGPQKMFTVGAHPALTVDIGYADLTIIAGKIARIEVSVIPSTAYGNFGATAPIAVRADGETIRIAKASEPWWCVGDDRMVTVMVPPDTQVSVLRAGDIKAEGLHADASLNSVGRGSVTVENYDAPALHASATGRIVLHQIVAARLDATSSDGHVEGTALRVRDGSVESGGRVTLGFATGSDTLVTAATSHGKVRVSGLTAGESGAIERRSSDDDDAELPSQTVRVGAGTGRLDVHSSDGNINLFQES